MSQSNSTSGSRAPKDSAHECRHRQATNSAVTEADTDTDTGPEPACWRHSSDNWEWRELSFTAAYRDIHDPCGDCFQDGPPDVTDLETVVRSCSYPVKYHRPRDGNDDDQPSESPPETTSRESKAAARPVEASAARVSVENITELEEGDDVVWETVETPMEVARRNPESGNVVLRGPAGGEYRLRTRYDGVILIYPGHGCIDSLTRIVPNDHARPEPETV